MNRRIVAAIAALALGAAALTGCSEATPEQKAGLEKVRVGMTMSDVRSLVGEPNDVQTFDTAYGSSACWYYGISEQVCFDENRVSSKNSY